MKNIDPKRYQDAQDKTNRQSVNVAAIVRVTAFDPVKMTVDVQPLSKHLEGGVFQSQPQILGVPISSTKSGGFLIRPWVNPDDIGLVVYIDHDIDRAISEGKESEPNTERNHSTSDAVFIGGIVPGHAPAPGNLPSDAVVISTEDGNAYIAIKPGQIELVGNVSVSGGINATGDVKAGNISLQSHTHGGVESGPGSTGRPQ